MNDTAHVKGLKDLHAFLQTLPKKIEKNIMRGALRAGLNVLKEEAKQSAPIGPASNSGRKKYGNYRGLLRDSLRVDVNSKNGRVTGKLKAGGKDSRAKGRPVAYYALMVHQGTKPHRIKPRKPGGALWVGGKWVGEVFHPGTKGQPFMRETVVSATNQRQALKAFRDYIAARLLKKHQIDVPGAGNWDDPE